ncbi:hypothetical protein GCM10007978_22380 [Shewanella hanedai]|uniref:Uncharacterized protein n=1 Tax=Shewanella hanedai TaxID=25 RepID=A0A553JNT6_SHEHA|nr:hypothetical protein [Shewanella hanedai]TRY14090.1 hypothetical protein FN961_12200 [Shewanella hanedai]GGI84212.1 hypothetical protein GCM10007978_22380 [Shewanella hanedai]
MKKSNTEKNAFIITRLNTTQGIIKATGEWAPSSLTMTDNALLILTLDIMSTDGWVALDLTQSKTKVLLDELNDEVLLHLQTR